MSLAIVCSDGRRVDTTREAASKHSGFIRNVEFDEATTSVAAPFPYESVRRLVDFWAYVDDGGDVSPRDATDRVFDYVGRTVESLRDFGLVADFFIDETALSAMSAAKPIAFDEVERAAHAKTRPKTTKKPTKPRPTLVAQRKSLEALLRHGRSIGLAAKIREFGRVPPKEFVDELWRRREYCARSTRSTRTSSRAL